MSIGLRYSSVDLGKDHGTYAEGKSLKGQRFKIFSAPSSFLERVDYDVGVD